MAADGLLIKPLLFRYFNQAQFPDEWTVTFRKVETDTRVPDGWFHPSEHPLMHERQLYYYLTEPDRWQGWVPDYTLRISTLMGTAVHDLVQMALGHLNLSVPPSGTCLACQRPQPSQCNEHGAIDEETHARGHLDGILKLARKGMGGFELKTCAPMALLKIQDGDVEAYKKKWPYYYAQNQEYMRMTGLPWFVVLFMGLGNPWEMREFVIEADYAFQEQTRQKYMRARRAAESGDPPIWCCGPGTKAAKECPARACERAR